MIYLIQGIERVYIMNSVELIGIVRGIKNDRSDNQYLVLEVNRPYLDKKQSLLIDYFNE